ncbi:BPTD_3080 family restriction endonuclease [Methyloligella solikamskensis]|uniref:BPTD_3080 family restriction endonuclease n=1 Tax=Methyloligella solikamskensis TaxID=1177756 RepID=A0ABW3J727_9HYPH
MTETFYEQPILNSPYEEPTRHHALDEEGQPLDQPPVMGRRRSELITPVPKPRKRRAKSDDKQTSMNLQADDGLSSDEQEYNPTPIINEIRSAVASWRKLPSQTDWGVTPTTARLLQHWRQYDFQGVRPFFCQVEAVETIIWLTEVARNQKTYKHIWDHIQGANEQANPDLLRLAMKMATGAGKTTVMAMLMAWQTVNAVRSPTSKLFTRGFLIVTPGITIRDRLRVLQPNDPESYYKTRELVPADMLEDINKAKIVITNYHSFQLRELMDVNKVGKSLLQGRGEPLRTQETEGQMVRRVAEELMGLKNVVVINDEAHHCYREKPGNEDIDDLKGDEKKEAEAENKAARVWINGIEAFKRKLGVRAVYDLSATPFFLSGSGWAEGTLFPWTVSDFSLIDAIECGIVKLPRVPVADNIPGADVPIFRNLWEHIGKDMPKKGKLTGDPLAIPDKLKTALHTLYKHYEETFEVWERAGIETPPVFIVVCNNTSTSKLVHEWISGWQRPNDDGEEVFEHNGHLKLFRNFDENGNRFARPNTLLIDSNQIESGDALDKNFREIASLEIEQFKREIIQRSGAGDVGEISDAELLREVMNTVGKKGRLGEKVRCVVSVSMLTEGWDANTVTHILGIRAFGTQLLCEQVVGRGLRRYSYELNNEDLFNVEYADIMGIPFDFTAKPQPAPVKPPKKTTRVHAVRERSELEILFPRVTGYRVDLPEERLTANFNDDSKLVLTPEDVGPGQTLMEGIVGEGVMISAAEAQSKRPSTIAYDLAKHLLMKYFKDADGEPKLHLFWQIKRIARQWIDDGYLECKGDTGMWMLEYLNVANQATERIYNAIVDSIGDKRRVKAVLDPYNPSSSTSHVGFSTTKDLYETEPKKCHINYVVIDSDWEAEFARVAEQHPNVISYAKNQGLGFEVPYKDGSAARHYIPDFIVKIDDGHGKEDPLNLVVEVKGFRNENVKLKSQTVRTQWVPGVNNLGLYGRWAFEEFNDVYEIDKAFKELIDRAINGETTKTLQEEGAT